MPATQQRYQATSYSRPVATSGKTPSKIPLAYPAPYAGVVVPTPKRSTPAGSAVPSLTSDSGSNSSDCDGPTGIDLVELLNDKLSVSVDREPLDRSLARQAQT